MLEAGEAARTAVERIRSRVWGLAVGVVADGVMEFECDPGTDALDESTLFQAGSITKTLTGLLLADAVHRGELALTDSVGSILGPDAGQASDVTLVDLATQHSGLPRLPGNLRSPDIDERDPYAHYVHAQLLEALAAIERPNPGVYEYSNFGFMLLGQLIERATGQSYADLASERVFVPAAMKHAVVGVPPGPLLPGYSGVDQTPWWTIPLPGPGALACNIQDLVAYLQAHISPPQEMQAMVTLALEVHNPGPPVMGLGWIHQGGGYWHNGGTGGFRSFVAFHAPTKTGIALLANTADASSLDNVGLQTLTELARSRI